MALKIGGNFQGKLTCASKMIQKSLKNSNIILEIKMVELNQNKKSK